MTPDNNFFDVRLATDDTDLKAAQRLRYRVFVEELGGDGLMVDHEARLERDEFDLIAVGRALISDPAWVRHVQTGAADNLKGFEAKDLAELV